MGKVAVIIQARLTSKRFPNKVFSYLNNKFVIDYLIDGLKPNWFIDKVIYAIPNTKPNDLLEYYLKNVNNQVVFRGFENDVLARYYNCATKYRVSDIIRVCSDTPLIRMSDIEDNYLKYIQEGKERMIYGNGSWIFSYKMLKEAHLTQPHASSREHVVRSMFNSIDYEDDISRIEKLLKKQHL